jgi:hypothetical protein
VLLESLAAAAVAPAEQAALVEQPRKLEQVLQHFTETLAAVQAVKAAAAVAVVLVALVAAVVQMAALVVLVLLHSLRGVRQHRLDKIFLEHTGMQVAVVVLHVEQVLEQAVLAAVEMETITLPITAVLAQ